MEDKKKNILNIFYPNDIDSIMANRDVQTMSSRVAFVLSASAIGDVILYFVIMNLIGGMGIDIGFLTGVLIVLILDIVVFLPIFRKFVFKEDKLRKEHFMREQDNFARYYKIGQKEYKKLMIRCGMQRKKIDIVKYDSGLVFSLLQLRFGSNTENKVINNKKAFREFFRYMGEQNLEVKVIVNDENFSTSKELNEYLKKLNNSPYRELGMMLLNQALEFAEDSNVETLFILIKTRTKSQEYGLNVILAEVYNIFTSGTSFRSVEYLNYNEIKEFAEEYYGVEVIDLSKISTVTEDIRELREFDNYVELYTQDNIVEEHIKTDGRIL